MKKTLFTLFSVFFFFLVGFSQKSAVIKLKSKKNSLVVSASKSTGFTLTSSMSELNMDVVSFKEGEFMSLQNSNLIKIYDEGIPNIPVLSKLIEVPQGATVELIVKSYDEEIIKLSDYGITDKIQPALQSQSKSEGVVPFVYNEKVYKTDDFINKKIAEYEYAGQIRATRLGHILIHPIQYNPIKNIIKVLNNLVIEVKFNNANISKTENLKAKYSSPYFNNMLEGQIINSVSNSNKELVIQAPTHLVIIADRMFEAQLAPFIAWKIKKGFNVTVGYTDQAEVGNTTSSIKAYLQGIYEGSSPMSFVLFVGDVQQIPAWTGTSGSHVTDLYYCEYTGDLLPEVYYGRFSAQNTAQLQPQIDKTLMYEKYEMSDPSYLAETMLVTGDDSGHEMTWGNGQMQYGVDYYFNLENNINNMYYPQPGDNGQIHNDIITNMNSGLAFANYSAHCSQDGWATPSFSRSDVAGLTNDEKYGLWIGNCCLSVKFDDDECFGEAALRKANGGAIGDIGGSNSTYWDEDYWWGVGLTSSITANPTYEESGRGAYDGVFHTQANEQNDITTWMTTQGQVLTQGQLAVEASTSSRKTYYWEIYHLMGDPSLTNFIGAPQAMAVTPSPASLMLGMTSLSVSSAPYAYVALSQGGILFAVAMSDAYGSANLTFAGDALSVGDADLVVTAQNRVPYIGTISVNPADEPYIVINSYTTSADPNYGDAITLNVTLENVAELGSGYDATNVNTTLSTSDAYVTITDNTEVYGDIEAGATLLKDNAYAITIANNVPDQHVISFNIAITADGYNWDATLNLTANAPALSISDLTIMNDENSDGTLDPGETGDIVFSVSNIGHADASFDGNLSEVADANDYLTLNATSVTGTAIATGAIADFSYSATADVVTPLGSPVSIKLDVEDDATTNYTASSTQEFNIGIIPIYLITDAGPYSVCTGTFYDSGNASGEYSNNETETLTFLVPAGKDSVIVDFISFSTENNYDSLMVYDGPDTSSPYVGKFMSTNSPGKLMGANGLTFKFKSDGYTTSLGWEAELSCVTIVAPIADFVANQTTVTAGASVVFTDMSENNPTSHTWTVTPGIEGTDFEYVNSTSSSSKNLEVKFISANTYTIALEVTNSVGSDTETKSDYILVNAVATVPDADFEANFTNITTGDNVIFADLSTNLPTSWEWTISPMTGVTYENATDANSQNPEVKFSSAGVFTVSLVATNSFGPSTMMTKTDYITAVSEIVVGTGIVQSNNYPFNNYWENNKTQILYLQSELGGQKTLTDISFDFSFITPDVAERTMTDFTIKMKNVPNNAFSGAYLDDATAKQVFFEPSYTLPDATGWHTFDITNFGYNGTDNLFVEIVWGDNGFYSASDDKYKVNCTDMTKSNLVAYGYSDSETPPNYDGQSSVRPNVKIKFNHDAVGLSSITKKDVKIYPNPTNGLFTVVTEDNDSRIEIYSVNGQLVYSEQVSSLKTQIDLSNLVKGIYFIKVSSDNKVANSKVILQ